ncbi:DeoR/GlpR transcriptional regulator [Pseudoclavibacter chungangensis]|uniref:Lactose phosphotransferase system repressor n=1 Tax=Pseudoclavibacter chungangensis TaxID=587635 RepID=A0A7J5BQX2_9MICO|nr:DeoR/GlpR family DNA-binding transcription regulator [Pseudoclavibacter chungangensis]KAB1656675.1 DeoR/GlpR transcriptional regulator [Pseudoclavibacter chungangensis]NYJ67873.1 DeoR family fructose operon transcriptional repressor [Pseudoclavibacter chungangensis]
MYATERQAQIERLVTTAGRASVAELAERLQVTTETIRRDLDRLESIGDVRRVHGGAVAADRGSTTERDLSERSAQDLDAKRAIAVAAAAMVPPRFAGTLLLDAGSTTELVAEKLAARPAAEVAALTVISNSVPVIARLAGNPAIGLVALGGRVRGLTAAAVGPTTIEQLQDMRTDLAFIGTNGVASAFGLSTPDPDEAAVKRQMVRSSRRTIAVADASKFGAEALTRFATLDELDGLVTDSAPDASLADALEGAGVEVVLA